MILQALKEYYDRKAADPKSGIAPLGWERKEIPYLIVLDREGNLVAVEDTQEKIGKSLQARRFLVSQSVKRSGSVIRPQFLWDTVEYVTGIVCKDKSDIGRVGLMHKAFMERIRPFANVHAIGAVVRFLESDDMPSRLGTFDAWAEAQRACAFVAFKFVGEEGTVFDDADVKAVVEREISARMEGGEKAVDLVSGKRDVIALTHPALKGILGTNANTAGTNIVSFNFDAVKSFGKEQGENAPVGVRAAFAYTTALNTLLSKDSRQKMMVGDATAVFWAGRDDSFETALASFFAEPPKDDPDRLVQNVAMLFKSPQTGNAAFSGDPTTFYVLGLSPNAARLSVRFWHVGTVAEMAERFRVYFDDLAIVHGPKDKDHLSLWRLLVSTAVQGKSENVAPNLAGNVMRSILEGLPFPETLLQAVLMRIKAEHEVSYPRAKLIKGCLNRKWRFNNPQNERNLTVSLDTQNLNIGYRLGRLFAVLEKIQEAANPEINATIKDRFYASASSAPASVFGNLMRLSNHHLSKLRKEKPGYAINLEKLLQEVVAGLSAFPAHLSLDDQGQFAIGYYHQRQDLFTKKDAE